MPPSTQMQTLLQALRTGRTKTTDSLDQLFANPIALQADPHLVVQFRQVGHLDKLDQLCKDHLKLSAAEVAHIDSWPKPLKEEIRARLVNAIDGNLQVRFRWKLTTAADEAQDVVTAAFGETITFRSPESRVKAQGSDDVSISVGP